MSVAEFFFEFLEHTFYNSPAFRGSAFAPLALRANCLSQPLQSGLGFLTKRSNSCLAADTRTCTLISKLAVATVNLHLLQGTGGFAKFVLKFEFFTKQIPN